MDERDLANLKVGMADSVATHVSEQSDRNKEAAGSNGGHSPDKSFDDRSPPTTPPSLLLRSSRRSHSFDPHDGDPHYNHCHHSYDRH